MTLDEHENLKSTPLTGWHQANGGRMVPFAGFEMPVQYEGVIAEHTAVRERVGLFDITHMGEIRVQGPGAAAWLDGLVANRVAGGEIGKVVYTPMCRDDGGVLDDMLIYHLGQDDWLIVCNAANHAKIASRVIELGAGADGVTVRDQSDETALIAVQGPDALDLVGRIKALRPFADRIAELEFYTTVLCDCGDREWIVSRTGYSGERGYEIYIPCGDALALWLELMTEGDDLGVAPIGLAARDTLRFEMAYCLYGHELAEDITPLEAGISWAIRFKNHEFVGREALQAQKAAGIPRRLIGIEPVGRGIIREGCKVFAGAAEVGHVTSGTFCPSLKGARGLALVAAENLEDDLVVEVRGKMVPVQRVDYPFLAPRVKGDPRAER